MSSWIYKIDARIDIINEGAECCSDSLISLLQNEPETFANNSNRHSHDCSFISSQC